MKMSSEEIKKVAIEAYINRLMEADCNEMEVIIISDDIIAGIDWLREKESVNEVVQTLIGELGMHASGSIQYNRLAKILLSDILKEKIAKKGDECLLFLRQLTAEIDR